MYSIFRNKLGIFGEWSDNKFSLTMTQLLMIGLFLITIFLSLTTNLIGNQTLFIYLALISIIILIIATIEKEKVGEIIQANFFNNRFLTYGAILMGMAIGYVLSSRTGFALILPTQSILVGDLQFFLANILAPLVEPLFWRGIIFPTTMAIMAAIFIGKSKGFLRTAIAILFALVISSAMFGYFHINVFFGQTASFEQTYDLISIATLMGLLFTLGNQIVRTVAFEIGWHFTNNLYSEAIPPDQILPTMIVAFIAFAIIIEISNFVAKGR